MKVVVVFLLAVLGCSLTAGTIVSKCDLRNQLVKAIKDLTVDKNYPVLSEPNQVAKLVCHAEKSSGFNTSAVNTLDPGQEDHNPREDLNWPHDQDQQDGDVSSFHARPPPQSWVLYGVFQLSDTVFCSNGVNKTLNICETDCSTLLDDNATNDVSCLLKFFSSSNFAPTELPTRDLLKMIHLIFQKDCRTVNDADYFAGCPPPPN